MVPSNAWFRQVPRIATVIRPSTGTGRRTRWRTPPHTDGAVVCLLHSFEYRSLVLPPFRGPAAAPTHCLPVQSRWVRGGRLQPGANEGAARRPSPPRPCLHSCCAGVDCILPCAMHHFGGPMPKLAQPSHSMRVSSISMLHEHELRCCFIHHFPSLLLSDT